ncbi:asparagine synthase C-terminal domain-containing protein [Stetteria hydrogenophila]
MGCLRLSMELASLVNDELSREGCDCLLLSGGVDTSFTAVARMLAGGGFRLAVVVSPWRGGDLPYALKLADALGLRVVLVDSSRGSFRAAVDLAALAEATADPVEVAGSAAAALGLAAAKAEGCSCVATGDGGDELFLGYGFLLSRGPWELESWRERMAGGGARFGVDRVAGALGVRVAHPLYAPAVREFSLGVPLECLVARGPGGRVYGKYLMRLYLHHASFPWLAWRPKTPVTHGSGALEALEDLSRGARPVEGWEPSEPHAYLVARLRALGALPGRCGDPSRACPVCGRCMDGGFCRFCGAYLAGGGVSVYRPRGVRFHYEPGPSRVEGEG